MAEDQLIHKALHIVDVTMSQVKQADLDRPTPCTEWDVHDLINHIISEVAWVEPLLQGKTIAQVGDRLDGDLLGLDFYDSWRQHLVKAMSAASLVRPDATVHLSYGDKPAIAYLDEVGGDIIIHAWDLAQAIGGIYIIDENTCIAVENGTKDIMSMGRENGLVAAALPVENSASAMEKLLANFGRDINWVHDSHKVA